MTKLHFNYKDIFRAFRLGFNAKKIWVGFQGLLFAWIGYTGITYLAYWLSGADLLNIWSCYKLFPMPASCCADPTWVWWIWLIWTVGVVWFVFVSMVAGIAISKLTYEQLRGDEFYEVKEAWKQAIKSAGALIATPILLGLFIVLLLAAGLLLGLIGRIPAAGEVIVGVLALLAFAVSLFIIYLIVVFFFTFTISPAVIGTTKSDAFDNLFEVFSCVSDQSWRLIWYQLMLLVFIVVGISLLTFFSWKAIQLGRWVMDIAMNVDPEKVKGLQVSGKLGMMLEYAKGIVLPHWAIAMKNFIIGCKSCCNVCVSAAHPMVVKVTEIATINPGIVGDTTAVLQAVPAPVVADVAGGCQKLVTDSAAVLPEFSKANVSIKIGSILMAVGFHAVILFVLAYGMAIWYAGNTLVYLILVRKKDDRNLLEIKDEEIEIPEKIDVAPSEPEPAEKLKKALTKKAPRKSTRPKK